MTRWLRQLFRSMPVAPIVKSRRTTLGLQRLEERETPATFTVTITGDSGAGSLRDAVAQANSTAGADTIVFQAGLGAVVLTSGQLTITDTTGATTISGPSGGTQVVQRSTAGGTPDFRIFNIAAGTANLNHLTISNGRYSQSPANGGGGILNNGTLTVTNSTISGNVSTNGGGGGISTFTSGTLTVTNSTISGNSSSREGGGIYSESPSFTITNSTISGNTASREGGGIYNVSPSFTVTNSTISGNTSSQQGGGIFVFAGNMTLTNVTTTSNRSDNDNSGGETGGGLFRDSGTVTLNNTLIAGNFRGTGTTRQDVGGAVVAASANNLIGDGTGMTGITNGTNGNQIGTAASPIDAKLGTLGTYGGLTQTHAILAGSPAINTGSNALASGTNDGRGAPFVRLNGTVDIGAFEVQATPVALVVSNTGDTDDGNFGAGQLTLREAMRLSLNPGADTITFAAGLGAVELTSGQLSITDTTGATTISGPSGGTQVVQRSMDGGTPDFRIFRVASGVTANFSGLTISNGQDVNGSGIYNFGTLTVSNSTISGNTTTSFGGGGIENTGTLTVSNSTISGNTAFTDGGGIWSGNVLTVTNSTISGNFGNTRGGAIFVSAGTVAVTNVTITGNRSDNNNSSGSDTGGGLFRGGGTVTLNNTLIAGNFRGTGTTRDDVNGTLVGTSANNLIGDGIGLTGISNGSQGNQIGTGAAPIDAKLGTLGFYGGAREVFALLAGSPAINAGSNSAATNAGLTSDGRGSPFVRTFGGTVDIGAYEVQLLNIIVDNAGDPDDGNITAGQFTLREAVRLANGNPGADTISFAPALGPITLTSGQLTLSDATGATTISGPSSGTQVIQRSAAVGTPNFRIFQLSSSAFSANLNNLTISNGNINTGGGGISNSGTLTVTNSTISGNSGDIGGIANFGTLTVTNSTISGNSGFGSGGIQSGNTLTVTNSTISGNFGNGSGGGIFVVGGTASLTNVTVTGNRSDNDNTGAEQGGGLRQNGGTVTLNNTLIAGNFRGTGNTRDDVNGAVASTSANNLIGDGTGLTGISNGSQGNLIGTGAAPINPLLLPLANNGGVTLTHAIGQNSPALGKGSTTVAGYSPFDQRGASRDVANGASPDIGAYEVNHPLAPVGVPTTLGGMFQPKPSASANEAFVKGLYQSTLLRAPDAAGLAGWVAQLNGGTSRSTVANGFVNSTENRRNQVTFFYRYFLSREPDTAGLNGWVSILQGGRDEGEVMTGFILSNEFSGQNNNSQFVNLMYYALLSRQADTAGFNGWVNALTGGMSRATVVNAFLRSEEGINRVVDSLFQSYLKRYGSTGDLGAYRTFLATNTFGQAATLILSSAEFFTNAGNNLS